MTYRLGEQHPARSLFVFVLLTCLIFLSTLSPLYANEYSEKGRETDSVYYTAKDGSLENAFNFKLGNIFNPIAWIFNWETFTLLKEVETAGKDTEIQGYFNVPNLQTLSKNLVLSGLADGYQDTTYKVEDTERLIPVGDNAITKDNAIAKYGFHIPNYTYYGEYPRVYMSVQNVVPTSLLGQIWSFVKGIIGLSFIDAPNTDDFKTVGYFNHGYADEERKLVFMIQVYWKDLVDRSLNTDQFDNPEEFRRMYTTEEIVKKAKAAADLSRVQIPDSIFDGLNHMQPYPASEAPNTYIGEAGYNTLKDLLELQENHEKAIADGDKTIYLTTTEEEIMLCVGASETIQLWDKYYEEKHKWDEFKACFDRGNASDKTRLHYNQCLIENMGETGDCLSTKYSTEPTTLMVGNVLAFSGVYEITKNKESLTQQDALKIIQTLQAYCGAYYQDVMSHLLVCMQEIEKAQGGRYFPTNKYTDPRQMPYDVSTLSNADQLSYSNIDPRTHIYIRSFFGGIVANLRPGGIGTYFRLQPMLINLGGRLTEYTIMLQRIKNFDFFDSIGLSPTLLWSSPLIMFAISILVLFFIVKIGKLAYARFMDDRSGILLKIISATLVILFEIMILLAVLNGTDKVWGTVKRGINTFINIGETSVVSTRHSDLEYLSGSGDDKDIATMYYIPYLNQWSKYNTGYSIMAPEQKIAPYKDKPECKELHEHTNWPKIGEKPIEHWSIMLLDSFTYDGHSDSLRGLMVTQDGDTRIINGHRINNNAYRVVDHFLAPHIKYEKLENGNIKMSTTMNENYNHMFQAGYLDIFVGLMIIGLIFLIALVQTLTFFWMWLKIFTYPIAIFTERVLVTKGGHMQLLAQTFVPVLQVIFIGMYAGLIIVISADLSGWIGFLLAIGLYKLSFMMFNWWSKRPLFPKPLTLLAMFTDWVGELKNRPKKKKQQSIFKRKKKAKL